MVSFAVIYIALYFRKKTIYVGEEKISYQDEDQIDDSGSRDDNRCNHTMEKDTIIKIIYKRKS